MNRLKKTVGIKATAGKRQDSRQEKLPNYAYLNATAFKLEKPEVKKAALLYPVLLLAAQGFYLSPGLIYLFWGPKD